MASAVLGLIMLAVATAIGSAQKLAFESQKRLLASIAADDLLAEINTLEYDDLTALNGRNEGVGAMKTLDREAYPDSFWPLGRGVSVSATTIIDKGSGASVDGQMITVSCFDEYTDLAVYELFIADPDPEEEPIVAGGR